jgi:DNA-binding PadR family transcriptional regulator
MFDAGELRLALLLLLEAQPRHGYDFIREIEERTGGGYAPSPGVVYPTLTLLEELDQIAQTSSDGPKRLFAILPAGQAHLDAHRAEAEATMARLDALRAESSRIEAGPVSRALQNLKAVLHQRLATAQEKQTLFDVAALIDEAASKIERL